MATEDFRADQDERQHASAGSESAGSLGREGPARGVEELLSGPALGARRFHVTQGTALYEAEAPARHLFFIHEGQVRILQVGPRQASRLVEILSPMDWFGTPSLIRAGATADYGMRAVAMTDVTLSEVSAERVLDALPLHAQVGRELIVQLAFKLEKAYTHAARLVFDDTEQRLIKALLDFSRTAAAAPQEGADGERGGVVLKITHQQLAQAVGAARETVSLTLTGLKQKNLLNTGRNKLTFVPQVLRDFAGKLDPATPVVKQADPNRQ